VQTRIHPAFNVRSSSAINGVPVVTIGSIVVLLLVGGSDGSTVVAQLTIRQQLIIRVPARPQQSAPVQWKEKNGPKCVPAGALAGAQVSREGVDLLLRGGQRVRAKLSRCAPLDYYSGFYVRPGLDGRICQDRDTIRVRSGGSCEIDAFRTLVPAKNK
jgi:hypothetical protein